MSRPYNKVCRVINTGYILASIIVHPNQTALGWKPPLSSCSQISAGMWRANSLEETLMLEKIEGRRRGENKGRDGWMAITDSTDMSVSKLQEMVKDREDRRAAAHGVT